MFDPTPATEPVHLVARRFAHRLLDLAAEMRVDGVDDADCERLEAHAGGLLISAVKAERRISGVDAMTDPAMQILRAAAPFLPVVPSWPYRATGEIINGVETLTGRFSCCGLLAEHGEHHPGCPRITPVETTRGGNSWSLKARPGPVMAQSHTSDHKEQGL